MKLRSKPQSPTTARTSASLVYTGRVPGLLAALCLSGFCAGAQTPPSSSTKQISPPQANPASQVVVNDWLRSQSPNWNPWDIGGQFRLRYELRENAGAFPNRDFIEHQDGSNDTLLERLRYHVGYTPTSWASLYVEGRSSFEQWDKRRPSPEADAFNLRQAYVTFGNSKEFPISAKLGRQELLYGEERFVGIGDWSNTGRTFDAAKLRYQSGNLWVDLFSGRVVIPRESHLAIANDYDWFSGVYSSLGNVVEWQETQLYLLSRNVGVQAPNSLATGVPGTPTTARDIYTIGTRWVSTPKKLRGWDYSLETAVQFGSIHQGDHRRDQESFAVFTSVGHTWDSLMSKPRLGVGYEFGTGDSDPNDDKNGTFENLFGTNHRFYGAMDLFSQRNMHIPRLSTSIKPLSGLSLGADLLFFFLSDTRDFLYPESGSGRSQNGYGRHPEFDAFVGTELDVFASYAVPRFGDFQFGYGHFFTGKYLNQSVESLVPNGNAIDADWVYVQWRYNF